MYQPVQWHGVIYSQVENVQWWRIEMYEAKLYQTTCHCVYASLPVCVWDRQTDRQTDTRRDIKRQTERKTQWQMVAAAHKAAYDGDLIRNRRREKRFSRRSVIRPSILQLLSARSGRRPASRLSLPRPRIMWSCGRCSARWRHAIREKGSKRPGPARPGLLWRANERPRPSVRNVQRSMRHTPRKLGVAFGSVV